LTSLRAHEKLGSMSRSLLLGSNSMCAGATAATFVVCAEILV
jgi:hypothetical protein